MILRIIGRRPSKGITRVSLLCGVAALTGGVLSATVHLLFGHGPDSPEPMLAGQFFSLHKAYWLVLVLAVFPYLGSVVCTHTLINND
jgi:hypothetical protein